MTNLNEYLKIDAERQLKVIEKIQIQESIAKLIKESSKKIDLVVYAESFCPDCVAIVGILENFAKISENLNIQYIPREGNEVELEKLSGKTKIPTIILNNKAILIELPECVEKKIELNPIERAEIVYNFRTGKYNEEIIEELYEKIYL